MTGFAQVIIEEELKPIIPWALSYPQIRNLLSFAAIRQRIANLFPPAHRLVFVVSIRQCIASF
jgi:hypothetical protein